jgi:hypothetical protein
MSWMSDVRDELKKLDQTQKSLKKFGFLVGSVFIMITLWMILENSSSIPITILGSIGGLLIIFSIFHPDILKPVHKIWMGLAFSMGWLVSRILLIFLFSVVAIPIGIMTRLFGKDLIDHKIEKEQKTYWIPKKSRNKSHFEKLY